MVVRSPSDLAELSIARADNDKLTSITYAGFIRELRQLQIDDWDNVIAVTGQEGVGKSACALNMAYDIDDAVNTELQNHVVWDGSKLKNLIFKLPPSAIVVDEGGLDFFSRDALDRSTKDLIKMVMIMRMRKHVPIVVLPNMRWLDTYLREHRINIWVKVWALKQGIRQVRGFATVFVAQRGDFSKGTYWKDAFSFRFADFHPSIIGEYKRLKERNMMERMLENESTGRDDYIRAAASLKINPGQTHLLQKQIGEIFGITRERVSQILKETNDIEVAK